MASTADDYRSAALERMGDADELRRLQRYPFAMYAAGVAVNELRYFDQAKKGSDTLKVA